MVVQNGVGGREREGERDGGWREIRTGEKKHKHNIVIQAVAGELLRVQTDIPGHK